MKNQKPSLRGISARSDDNKTIDWFFAYKIAGKSISTGPKATGYEYIYYDSSFSKSNRPILSNHLLSDAQDGCFANTLNQLYNSTSDSLGWFMYNDEDPITNKTNGQRGHTKGVLAFDLKTNTSFWLIHSAPKFPSKGKYTFPKTAIGNAQSFLCITLKDVATAENIAAQMMVGQQPNVYLASKIPQSLKNTSPLYSLIKNKISTDKTPYANFITFYSKKKNLFRCIAKNKEWDKKGDDDFYNDLVGPVLHENIEVETWEHYKEPGTTDSDKVHKIKPMKSVDLAPLGIKPSYSWSEENDHAKIAISDSKEKIKYVCIGDLNFTTAQEERSGGTVAFINPNLWEDLNSILSTKLISKTKSKK